ncbi:ABC transporter ATP-binding protein [Viridibacillus sp. YIM B01967]|uniref:ABC transporter ATP-binding protein n=1 Tax=Viridibacillus soli TaxID=2798301 RepID=A0ABS1H6Y2_9BACL|nr:ABC transporter ATP-binding protein [Viridibacillus soli]MBK3495059.1 ABC transporter ATP-binding protein [Viridibacillus soli]
MRQQPLLIVDNLNVAVSTPHGMNHTVHNVNLKLEAGKVLGLVGESGSGKTMTCMSLLNLLPEKAEVMQGNIKFKDIDLLNCPTEDMRKVRGSEIALIMQNPMIAFNPVRTIERHFIETLRTHLTVTKRQARKIAVDFLGEMDLPNPESVLKQYPFQLSGGMLQRVMIAITMSLNPSVLIADEPTTALDATNQLQVLKQLDKLRKEYNTGILLVSHDLGVIAQLADEVAVMYGGYIVEQAPVLELFNHPKHPYTRVLLESRLGLTRRKMKSEKQVNVSRPNLIHSENACPFIERCGDADHTCLSYNLEFIEYKKDHLVRCVKSR